MRRCGLGPVPRQPDLPGGIGLLLARKRPFGHARVGEHAREHRLAVHEQQRIGVEAGEEGDEFDAGEEEEGSDASVNGVASQVESKLTIRQGGPRGGGEQIRINTRRKRAKGKGASAGGVVTRVDEDEDFELLEDEGPVDEEM